MEHRVYSQLCPPPAKSEVNSGIRLTVPDLSLSVPEIIRMALDGRTDFPMLIEDDNGEVFDLSKSDLTEVLPNANLGFYEDYEEKSASPQVQTTAAAASFTTQVDSPGDTQE